MDERPTQPVPPTQTDQKPRGWWPQVRAVLIALHLLAITLMALPSPGEGMDRSAWSDPTAQDEFATWVRRLNAWGYPITQQEFEDRLWVTANAYCDIHGWVLSPFWNRHYNYYDLCGTVQSWRMFAGPHRYPSRLEIDVRENGVWRPVYLQRDPGHAWQASSLDEYRFRPVEYRFSWYLHHYARAEDYTDFRGFARWLARQAARDFPQAERVRVLLVKRRTPTPEEACAGVEGSAEIRGVDLSLEEWR